MIEEPIQLRHFRIKGSVISDADCICGSKPCDAILLADYAVAKERERWLSLLEAAHHASSVLGHFRLLADAIERGET